MRCDEVMATEVVAIGTQTTIEAAAETMRYHDVGFLAVCDESGVAIGALTDRDIVVKAVADRRDLLGPVSDIISRQVVSCAPHDELQEAERLMSEHQVSRILCVDNLGRPVGVISLSDIAEVESGVEASETLRAVSARESHVVH